MSNINKNDIVYRLRKRAEIRRQIPSRKSVQEGKPDRLADLLEEAADEITSLRDRHTSGCGCIDCHPGCYPAEPNS